MEKFFKQKSLNKTLEFLVEIAHLTDEIVEPLTLSGIKKGLYRRTHPKEFSDNLHSLERRGYIKINRKFRSVELTNKGKIKLIENSIDEEVDGKWRMLSWDIPEKLAIKRRQLCRSIRRIGYKQVQKSLWACPFARADQVDLVISEYGLQDYVAYLRVDKTDLDKYLKQLFILE
ncbi:MAG: hypothetical protein WC451_00020 [Patescibacteria group bacterium]